MDNSRLNSVIYCLSISTFFVTNVARIQPEDMMVLVHRTPPAHIPIASVTVENVEITKRLVSHLVSVHGKRRILFLRNG